MPPGAEAWPDRRRREADLTRRPGLARRRRKRESCRGLALARRRRKRDWPLRRSWPGPAAAETEPRPATARQQPERMRRPESGHGQAIWRHLRSSPSPTPLGTAIHTKSRIRAIGRHDAPRRRILPHRAASAPSPGATRRRRKAGRNAPRGPLPCPDTTSKAPGSTSTGALKAGARGHARQAAGALSPQRAAPQARRRGAGVQRQGRRMAGDARRRQAPGPDRRRSRPGRRPSRPTCITCSRRSSTSGSTTWCRRRSRWACRGCSRC